MWFIEGAALHYPGDWHLRQLTRNTQSAHAVQQEWWQGFRALIYIIQSVSLSNTVVHSCTGTDQAAGNSQLNWKEDCGYLKYITVKIKQIQHLTDNWQLCD